MKWILSLVLVCLTVSAFAQVIDLGGSGQDSVVTADDGRGQSRQFYVKATTPERAVLAAASWIGKRMGQSYTRYEARKTDWVVTWPNGYSVSITCNQGPSLQDVMNSSSDTRLEAVERDKAKRAKEAADPNNPNGYEQRLRRVEGR